MMIHPYFRNDYPMGTSDPDPEPRQTTQNALSGYAEWFWLMTKNWKDVENRNWSITRYVKRDELPVRVYLHTRPARLQKWRNSLYRAKRISSGGGQCLVSSSQYPV